MTTTSKTTTKRADQTLELDAADFIDESPSPSPSMAPVVLDAVELSPASGSVDPLPPSDELTGVETVSRGKTRAYARVTRGVAISVGLCVAVFCVVAARAQSSAPASTFEHIAAASHATAEPLPRVPPATPWTAVVPAATDSSWGTISAGAGAAPLLIDGARITGPTAVVACGRHEVRAGRGRSRTVDIPCGGNVTIDGFGRVREVAPP
jgi:hypothetical protein